MLQELRDGHVTVEAAFEAVAQCGPPYWFLLDEAFVSANELKQFMKAIDNSLRQFGFRNPTRIDITDDTNFQYSVSEDLGYLRLDEMTEKITINRFKKALDQSIKAFQSKQGLIIDLRFNGGGWDYIAYKLASRLIKANEKVNHFERTRIKGTDEFTKLKTKSAKAKGKYQFTKPIVILTSDFTASPAEVFILMMKDLPYVTLIGDKTEGIFSDMYEFRLPNKWQVSLSNQQFFSSDMINYEGVGIPPDIHVLNGRKDIETMTDPVMETAIQYLRNQ